MKTIFYEFRKTRGVELTRQVVINGGTETNMLHLYYGHFSFLCILADEFDMWNCICRATVDCTV